MDLTLLSVHSAVQARMTALRAEYKFQMTDFNAARAALDRQEQRQRELAEEIERLQAWVNANPVNEYVTS